MLLHVLPLGAVLAYIAAAYCYVRSFSAFNEGDPKTARNALLVGLGCQLGFLASPWWESEKVPLPGFAYGLCAFSATLVLGFLVAQHFQPKLRFLGAFVAPLGVFFFLWASLAFHLERTDKLVGANEGLLWFHIVSAVVANALFAFSFVTSAALLFKEYRIRRKRLSTGGSRLPSLELLDKFNSRLLAWGLAVMTMGVGSGFLFALRHQITFLEFDPRLVWSTFLLFLYAVIVAARFSRGVRGRRGAWCSIAGFLLLVSSFFAVNFFGESFHVY